jgi:hypothetical protein
MMHGAPSSLSYSLHSTQHSYTTYTSDTIDQQHKNKQLKASNAKTGSHEFPEFLLEKFRNFGTWVKTEFPEIRKSEFPELQSLLFELVTI